MRWDYKLKWNRCQWRKHCSSDELFIVPLFPVSVSIAALVMFYSQYCSFSQKMGSLLLIIISMSTELKDMELKDLGLSSDTVQILLYQLSFFIYQISLAIFSWWCYCEYTRQLIMVGIIIACLLSHFSHVWLCAALRTVACQAPLPMGFSRQEYWTGLPCPPPGNLPDPGCELVSHVSFIGRQVLYQ